MKFRFQFFSFLIFPAQLWLRLCGWVCGIKVEEEFDIQNESQEDQ